MITVYSDRLEIVSRGAMPPGQTIEGFFLGESIPVNRKLSDLFLQLHISERSGRGVPKITGRYGRGAYEFRENSIALTIPFDRVGVNSDGDDGASPGAKDGAVLLNGTQHAILDAVRNNPNITHVQLMRVTGKGKTAVQEGLSVLKDRGLVRRVGSRKAGYWEVL